MWLACLGFSANLVAAVLLHLQASLDHGIRRTYADVAAKPTNTIAFFGGSTMWGSGSDDERTIPSAFAQTHPQYRAISFSETAHTTPPNLNALVQVLTGGLEPDVAAFYNGSSEINRCRAGLSAFSTTDEPETRELLERERRGFQTRAVFWSIFDPALESTFDQRGAFHRDESIYSDADHAGPNGNAIVAATFGEFLSQ